MIEPLDGQIFVRKKRIQYISATITVLLLIAFLIWLLNFLGSRIHSRSIPSGSITLSIQNSKYVVGDDVNFTIVNNYNSDIYINNTCPSEPLEVYKFNGTKWQQIHDVIDEKDCKDTDRQISIKSGQSVTGSFARWKNLFSTPGLYRVAAYVNYYSELPFQDFEIVERPVIPAIPEIPTTTSSSGSGSSNSSNQSTSGNSSSAGQTNTSTNQNSSSTGGNTSQPVSQLVTAKSGSTTAGVIEVSISGNYITVVSVTPNSSAGYTYYEGGRSVTAVEITFKGGGKELQVQLRVVNGSLSIRYDN